MKENNIVIIKGWAENNFQQIIQNELLMTLWNLNECFFFHKYIPGIFMCIIIIKIVYQKLLKIFNKLNQKLEQQSYEQNKTKYRERINFITNYKITFKRLLNQEMLKSNTENYSEVISLPKNVQQNNSIQCHVHYAEKVSDVTQQGIQINLTLQKINKQLILKECQDNINKQANKLLKLVVNNQKQLLEQSLKKLPFSINQMKFKNNWTLLHFAVSQNNLSIIRLLINNGANIQEQTSTRRRSIHLAVINNSLQAVELLIQFRATINCQDQNSCYPLHYAVDLGHFELVQIIIEKSKQTPELLNKNYQMMSVLDSCRDIKTLKFLMQKVNKALTPNFSKFNYYRNFILLDDETFIPLKSKAYYVQHILDKLSPAVKNKANQLQKQSEQLKKNKNRSKYDKLTVDARHSRLSSVVKLSVTSIRQSFMSGRIQSLNDYEILRKLGEGAFGQVFLVEKKRTSSIYALKCISKSAIAQQKLKNYTLTEKKVLLQMNNQFILHAHSFFQDNSYLYMVMQFCPGGDLEKFIEKCKYMHQDIVKWYAAEIAIAIGCLHNHNILFRDLKTANVLIDSKGHIKIADFGLAKQAQVSYSFVGSKAYLAPQMLKDSAGNQHNQTIDWYLFGVLIYQLLTGLPPFYNTNQHKMFKNIKQSKPVLPKSLSKQGKNLLLGLLEKNPKLRLGSNGDFEQIKTHPWFHDIDWDQIQKKKLPLPVPQIDYQSLRMKIWYGNLSQGKQNKTLIGWDQYEPLFQ